MTDAVVYSIRDWKATFECAQPRKSVAGPLKWVSVPTKHDGKVFSRIMARKDGLMIFASWILLVEVAAKCPIRGLLADADGPLTAADLNLKTRAPSEAFETALKVLSSNEFGWLIRAKWKERAPTVQDSTGQNNNSCCAASAELPQAAASAAVELTEFVFPTSGTRAKDWTLTKAKLAEYITSFPGLDVPAQLRLARQWCRDKPRQRKTATGMPGFITSWLGRSQNRGGGRVTTTGTGAIAKIEVEQDVFDEYFRTKKFVGKPTRHTTDPNWWWGTLRDGTQVYCKNVDPAKRGKR